MMIYLYILLRHQTGKLNLMNQQCNLNNKKLPINCFPEATSNSRNYLKELDVAMVICENTPLTYYQWVKSPDKLGPLVTS